MVAADKTNIAATDVFKSKPMKQASSVTVCTVIAVHLFPFFAFTQSSTPKYEIGINAGMFIYQGDLTPSATGSFKTPSAVFGINGSRRLTNAFAVRLDLNIGRLRGADSVYASPEWRKQRAFAFTTPVTEVTGSLVYYPMGTERKFSPYLFAGVGLAFINVKRDYSAYNAAYFSEAEGIDEGLQQDVAHKLPRTVPVLPLGIGVRYPLSQKFFLASEASYRLMRTDYLDGFSQAANPSLKDHYSKLSIGVGYRLGIKDKYGCPTVRF